MSMPLMTITPFSVRIDDSVREKLEKICDLTDRSKAYITSKAITEYVERNAWKVEALKQAKKEAEKGEFISHQAMGEWINSLGTDKELAPPEIDVFKNPV
jgi:predicted transcriptional regulator